jgi:hypothetical protein
MKPLSSQFSTAVLTAVAGLLFAASPTFAQTAPVTTTAPTTTATSAVDIAKDGVDPSLRDRIVSVYGVGTPTTIQTWWVIFYDPSVPSHGRSVKVENGAIVRRYEAKGGVVYADNLTFSRAQVAAANPALSSAQSYAGQHAIAYDQVRALLRMTTANDPLRWRVQLLDGTTSKGFVFVNATDGTFAMYSPPGSIPRKETSGTGGVVGDAQQAGNDVKNTFLGIGGDLQQFFTGERTVDQ